MGGRQYDDGVISSGANCDDFAAGTRYGVRTTTNLNVPAQDFGSLWWIVTTEYTAVSGAMLQTAYGATASVIVFRTKSGISGWSTWQAWSATPKTYSTTTAAGANVVVTATGELQRSTSSERYKDILADVVLSDELYNDAMQLKPILYRSTADADNPRHHYYSFSAEVMGAFDPAFALWRTTELVDEIVTDADGTEITIQKEVKLDKPVAEGLNINAILALNHAISIKQHKMLTEQADDIAVLTQAIEQLKKDK